MFPQKRFCETNFFLFCWIIFNRSFYKVFNNMWSRKDSLNLPVLLGQFFNVFFWLSGKKRQSPAKRRRRKRRKQNNGEGDEEHPDPSVSKSNSGSLPLTLDEPLTIPPALLGKISYKKMKVSVMFGFNLQISCYLLWLVPFEKMHY